MRSHRRALSSEFMTQAADAIVKNILRCIQTTSVSTVMLFLPSFNEPQIDTVFPLLWNIGIKTAVPVSNTDDFTITPYEINDLNHVIKGAYGIREPYKTVPIPVSAIDVAVIPGVAFGKHGERLGFGKGYYDRFLADFNGIKLGVCYDFQLLDALPTDNYDVTMNTIITEKRIYNDF